MYAYFAVLSWLVAVLTWPITAARFVYDVFKLDEPFWSALVSDGVGGLTVFVLALWCLITAVSLASDQ